MSLTTEQAENLSVNSSNLERKRLKRALEYDDAVERSPKRIKALRIKEPGHKLLDGHWINDSATPRPRLVSKDGEPLSYYIVFTCCIHHS